VNLQGWVQETRNGFGRIAVVVILLAGIVRWMATELFNYFEGDWSFTREIKTDGDKLFGLAKGKASFTKDTNESLYYSEDGELDLQQSKTKNDFYKSYFFSFYKDHIKVYFSGGANSEQLYQEYTYADKQILPIAGHACNRDFYNSEYHITDENQLRQVTTITGPKKDFLITTIFNRIGVH